MKKLTIDLNTLLDEYFYETYAVVVEWDNEELVSGISPKLVLYCNTKDLHGNYQQVKALLEDFGCEDD